MTNLGKEESVSPTIMVVDDDPTVVDSVGTALENEGYEFVSAESGMEALEKFEGADIDIVISDIKMPEVDGLDLLREVKDRSPSTHVIMMTAYASVDSAVEAMREGAVDYIRKPIDVKDIRSTLLGVLENLEIEEIQERTSTIVEGKGKKKPFETLKELVKAGRSGLCVSDTGAEKLRSEYGLEEENIDFALLSDEKGVGVSPGDLGELERRIEEFVSEREDSVVLLDGVDAILENNSLESFKEFVDNLEKRMVEGKATLMLSADLESIDEEDLEEIKYLAFDMPARIISESLSNHIRRKIISQLRDQEAESFTNLSKVTGINDSPKLSFHLKKLESSGLVEKDKDKRYRLTDLGSEAAKTLDELREVRSKGFGQIAWISK